MKLVMIACWHDRRAQFIATYTWSMEWWQILLIVVATVSLVTLLVLWILWRKASAQTKSLAARLGRLPWRSKLQLALTIMTDPDVPTAARIIPPLLILYLSLPIDIIPDFIPVLGQIDDVLVLVVGLGLLAKTLPARLLEERIAAVEREADICLLYTSPSPRD